MAEDVGVITNQDCEARIKELYTALAPYNHKLVVLHTHERLRYGGNPPRSSTECVWWDSSTLDECLKEVRHHKGSVPFFKAIDECGGDIIEYPLNGPEHRLDKITDPSNDEVIYNNPRKNFEEKMLQYCDSPSTFLDFINWDDPKYAWLVEALEREKRPTPTNFSLNITV